jgi:hypothetical protein
VPVWTTAMPMDDGRNVSIGVLNIEHPPHRISTFSYVHLELTPTLRLLHPSTSAYVLLELTSTLHLSHLHQHHMSPWTLRLHYIFHIPLIHSSFPIRRRIHLER